MRAWVTLATNDTDEMDASGRFYGQYLGSHMRIHLNDRSSLPTSRRSSSYPGKLDPRPQGWAVSSLGILAGR